MPVEVSPGPTRVLSAFLADLRSDAVPADVFDTAKVFVLDLIGTTLGARLTEEVRISVDVMRALGGTEEAAVIGHEFRTSCQNAAYLNALASHVLELDDTHRDSITHVGAPVFPAALAMAERQRSSGLEFLMAVIVGYEATLRVANAVQPSHWQGGFLSMGTCGTFGAAAAASHLMGVDANTMANALGLAGMEAAGLNSSIYGEGDMGKRLVPAQAASTGIVSALLASKGFTGSVNVLEQRKGFCASFAANSDLGRITENLGETFEIQRTSIKPYSCCRYNHAAIDGLLDMMETEAIEAGAIRGVVVRTYDIAVTNRPHRVNPKTLFDAKMSIPFSLAVAAHRRKVGEKDFTADLITDTALIDFASRVTVEADAAMTQAFPREWPASIEITLADGRTRSRHVPYPKGEPEAPMTRAELHDKFRDLASAAVTDAGAAAIIAEIEALDRRPTLEPLLQAIRDGLTRREPLRRRA